MSWGMFRIPTLVVVLPSLILAALLIGVGTARAECPPGEVNPVTSGTGEIGTPVVFQGLGGRMRAGFFLLGSGDDNNRGTLTNADWLEEIGDIDGDGLAEFRIQAPGDGPGGWGDPRTVGCPSTHAPPRPPLVVLFQHEREDLDDDGAFDVFEDLNGNRLLDASDLNGDGIIECGPGSPDFTEDRDCDGRLTVGRVFGPFRNRHGCEGFDREDTDCDGHLDFIDEDFNGNGRLDPGEDIDNDGRLDRGLEDRNGNRVLDDRPFPGDEPPVLDEHGNFTRLYPYGSLAAPPGGIIVASISWNGTAYDFDAINTPTQTITLPDGSLVRIADATPLARLTPRASAIRATPCPELGLDLRAQIAVSGIALHDDQAGTRAVFDHYFTEVNGAGFPGVFPATGNGAGGSSFFDFLDPFSGHGILPAFARGFALSTGSNGFLGSPVAGEPVLPTFFVENLFDIDRDSIHAPNDLCPVVKDRICFLVGPCDADLDGIGDACDPASDPDAVVGSAWASVSTASRPGPRVGSAAAYDARRGVVVLFGGSGNAGTWEYDGAAWRKRVTPVAPQARRGHRMVYDSARGRVLLFGGASLADDRPLNDLWQYDGAAWSRIEVDESPPPRSHGGLAYDSHRDRVVLFGGMAEDGSPLGDTWVFDGALWRVAPTPFSPPPTAPVAMAYDSFHEVTVMRGDLVLPAPCSPAPGLFGDETWEFDGRTWQTVDSRGDIPLGAGGGMVFDPGRRQILLIAPQESRSNRVGLGPTFGVVPTAATRSYDGISWTPLPTRDTLPARTDHAAAFDAARRTVVVYGGVGRFRANMEITQELRRPADTDDDGRVDPDDNCPLIANRDQTDVDGDDVGDACDNCPGVRNATQRDVDRDGLGNECDDDIDGDGVPNDSDDCPDVFVPPLSPDFRAFGCFPVCPSGVDQDGDGVGDSCDLCPLDPENDPDDDGVCSDLDNCPAAFNPAQRDGDGDGAADACDNCPTLANPEQDPDACFQSVVDLFEQKQPGKARLYRWRTTHEVDLVGFNLVSFKKGKKAKKGMDRGEPTRIQLNHTLIPCEQCATGRGADYSFFVAKKPKGARKVFLEMVREGGVVELFVPAKVPKK